MTTLGVVPRTVFPAPTKVTAPDPPEARGLRRDGVRLLVGRPDRIEHARFADLDRLLDPGDLLVVNTSATLPGALDGVGSRHGPVVVHVANRLPEGHRVVEIRSADATTPVLDLRRGDELALPAGATVRLLEPYPHEGSSPSGVGNRLWRAEVDAPAGLESYLEAHGRPIAYGYLSRRFPLPSYQTVFALHPGSAEMPSAARPFSTGLVTRLVSSGVGIAPITLHTGVSSTEAGEGPQSEWYRVPESTVRAVASARADGHRVIAVGTTATRALETVAAPDGTLTARSGWTDLVITPDRGVRVVDGLITGWHDPAASHLLLVEAVAGPTLTQAAYDAAVTEGYLWHEFGDSALLLPESAHRVSRRCR